MLAVVAAVVLLTACVGGGTSELEQQQAAEWSWLTETKQNLDGKRQQLAELREQAAESEVEVVAQGETEVTEESVSEELGEELAEGADLESRISGLEQEVNALSEEFNGRLVAFINADPMIEGETPTERQVAALRMKSDEDILLAREWIDRGGDYKRAIEIYNTALMFDPDNEKLKAALAEAEAERYMTEERFTVVDKGMTEAEVRALLGQVNPYNVREYPDKDVVAWFYPTAEDGSAAAVWFQPNKKSGVLEVYQVKFKAIEPGQEDEG
jgi:outer membrane murein-binding lipoprotein Lpp